ncbi:regulatory protein GemA [Rhizobium sp. YAF28]|uniref:regulatory protein GemA n=1 Tax=Rhizobium sp. YAF28 TaxID=3233081 RepID=UPI003F998547
MTSSIAAMHIAKKHLGLDDDTYRAKLALITGKQSAKDMTEVERQKVLTVFRNEGFAPAPAARRAGGRGKLTGRYSKKLQALWIAAWNLGIVRERDDAALVAFVKRQTGIDHTRFLVHADDANRAIEALKSWIRREAGVSYGNANGYDWLSADGAKVAWAQWRILAPEANLMARKGFDQEALRLTGAAMLQEVTGSGWQAVMNHFGQQIRQHRAERET